jgi:hypothetical protein
MGRDFHFIMTLPPESTSGSEIGEHGMIQSRNIALEIVVFGPQLQYVGRIIRNLIAVSNRIDRRMNEPTHPLACLL